VLEVARSCFEHDAVVQKEAGREMAFEKCEGGGVGV
jgi:hypothetical protein